MEGKRGTDEERQHARSEQGSLSRRPMGTPAVWGQRQGEQSFLPSVPVRTPDKSLSSVEFVHKTSLHTTVKHTKSKPPNKRTAACLRACDTAGPLPLFLLAGVGSQDKQPKPSGTSVKRQREAQGREQLGGRARA